MFTLNTKTLKNALDACVIPENVSKFFEKSTLVELSVIENMLIMNTEATALLSEVRIQGYSDNSDACTAIVSSELLRNLVGTITANETSLKFNDTSIEVISGRNRFTIPKLFTEDYEISLSKPMSDVSSYDSAFVVSDIWRGIQYNQIQSLSLSNVYQAYRRVWSDPEKGTLAGDPVKSYFTYCPDSNIDIPCLMLPSIVNLLADLSSDANLYIIDDSTCVVDMKTESFEFISQFSVDHEDTQDIGSYGSDMIFDMINDNRYDEIEVCTSDFSSVISQAALFVSVSSNSISFRCTENGIYLVNDNVDCKVCDSEFSYAYSIDFDIDDLKVAVSKIKSDTFFITPIVKDDEVFGVRIRYDKFVCLVGGIEE